MEQGREGGGGYWVLDISKSNIKWKLILKGGWRAGGGRVKKKLDWPSPGMDRSIGTGRWRGAGGAPLVFV